MVYYFLALPLYSSVFSNFCFSASVWNEKNNLRNNFDWQQSFNRWNLNLRCLQAQLCASKSSSDLGTFDLWYCSLSSFHSAPYAERSETKTSFQHSHLKYHKNIAPIYRTLKISFALKQGYDVLPCSVIWNLFLLQRTTACNISWGLTWALKLRGFHSLRRSSPNRCTKRNIRSPGGRLMWP